MIDLHHIPARPCAKCGCTERYKNGSCKTCSKIQSRNWAKNNPEKHKKIRSDWDLANAERKKATDKAYRDRTIERKKQTNAAWVKANAERVLLARRARYVKKMAEEKARNAAWYQRNKEKVRAYAKRWLKLNPDYSSRAQNKRRALKRGSHGSISPGLRSKLFKLQKGKCPCCQMPLGQNYHMDHIMPLSKGGENIDSNMQLLRLVCNVRKHAKHPIDYMQEKGFLL